MTLRKIQKALKRLKYIPKGKDFFVYSQNKIEHFARKATKSRKIAHPSTVMLELTNHCNLHCITCPREYKYGEQMALGHIDIIKLKSIVDQLYPYVDSIGLTGLGEPLLLKICPKLWHTSKQKTKALLLPYQPMHHCPKHQILFRSLKTIWIQFKFLLMVLAEFIIK